MCSDFPFYGNQNKRCEYQECTWEDGRNPAVPIRSNGLFRIKLVEKELATGTKEAA
jgi:hypothetical protein